MSDSKRPEDDKINREKELRKMANNFVQKPDAFVSLIASNDQEAFLWLLSQGLIMADSRLKWPPAILNRNAWVVNAPLHTIAVQKKWLKVVEYLATKSNFKYPFSKKPSSFTIPQASSYDDVRCASGGCLRFLKMMGADVDSPQIFYDSSHWQPDTGFLSKRDFALTPVTAFALSERTRCADVIDAVDGGVNILVPNGNGSTILQLLAERLIVEGGRSVCKAAGTFEKDELLKMFQFLVHHGASIENLEEQFDSFVQEISVGLPADKCAEAKAVGEGIRAQIKEALINAAPTRRTGLLNTFSSLEGKEFTFFHIGESMGGGPRNLIADYAVETGQSADKEEKEKKKKKAKR